VVEVWRVRARYISETGQGGEEVGLGRASVGLETLFGKGAGVEDSFYSGRGVGGEDFGGERGVLYVVEGEAGAVRSAGLAGTLLYGGFWGGIQVPGGDTRLEDEVLVGFGDTATVVDDDECAVSTSAQGRGNVDVAGAGVAGVAQELEESVLDGAQAPRAAPETLHTQQAGEASSKVPVRSFQEYLRYSFHGGHPNGHPSGRPR